MSFVGNNKKVHLRWVTTVGTSGYTHSVCGKDWRFFRTTPNPAEVTCKNCLRIHNSRIVKGLV
jgi:hypothetical protein